jgi:hypothetical protein
MKRLTLEPKFFKYHLKTGGSDDSNIHDSTPNSEIATAMNDKTTTESATTEIEE